jgi:diadenylate cyclase
VEQRGVVLTEVPLYDASTSAVSEPRPLRPLVPLRMKTVRFSKQFAALVEQAGRLCRELPAHAVLVLLEWPTDWQQLRQRVGDVKIIVAGEREDDVSGAADVGIASVVIGDPEAGTLEKLTKAILDSVARGILEQGARVVAVYSGFDPERIDSLSVLGLDEYLGRLTVQDLRRLHTSVPLETLKVVIDLAIEIGREGREGKAVGTMFVIGDSRRVLRHCRPAGFDLVKGYRAKDRDLNNPKVREAIKEIAQLDGAFIVDSDGIVLRSCQLISANYANVTLSAGLGARHAAAAAISKVTKAIAVVVSQSSGTVRVFQDGEVVLRIEPLRRPMKWRELESEALPPSPD